MADPTSDGRTTEVGRKILIFLALLLSACDSDSTPAEGEWAVAWEPADGSVLSCWSEGPDDVTFVGSDGLILHWNGRTLESQESGTDAWLWWGWGCGDGTAWAVGNGGTVLRHRSEAWSSVESGTDAPLFGVWGAACDDVWIVGGDVAGTSTDVVLRYRGKGLEAAGPDPLLVSFFKVWGSSADNVWVVGEGGISWLWDGSAWTWHDTGCEQRLFTVHGAGPSDVIAVGGSCTVEWNGTAWTAVDGLDVMGFPNGVYVGDDGQAAIVGFSGLKTRRTRDGIWVDETDQDPFGVDLHAVCGDGRGGFFAVGGSFVAPAAKQSGVIAHFGSEHPSLAQ